MVSLASFRGLFCKPYLGGVGVLIGILGLFLWYVGYRSTRLIARISYQIKVSRLIDKEKKRLPEEIKITFNNKELDRLVRTFLVFWNSGNKTILGQNIVEIDKPRAVFNEDSQILNAEIVRRTRDVNQFKIKKNENELILDFEYLDAGDGASIEILHTDEKGTPNIKGTIKEMPKGIVNYGTIQTKKGKDYLILTLTGFFISLVIIFLSVFPYSVPLKFWGKEGMPSFSSRIFMIVSGLFLSGQSSYALWRLKRRFPKKLTIDDLIA
ncbi:MAG: hypothetical protein ABSB18_06960 [Candidatus Omnitrophota bacterium]